MRTYLGQVRRLEGLALRQDEGQWRTLRQGLESVMTDGRLDGSLVGECGAGLSPG